MGRSKYSLFVRKSLTLFLPLILCLTPGFSNSSGFGATTIHAATASGTWNFHKWYTNLKTVALPSTMRTIGEYAFHIGPGDNPYEDYEKSKLKNITFPQGLKTIEESAFSGCVNLTSIDLPNSVTSIEDGAFYDCTKVATIKIRNKNCKIGGYYALPQNAIVYGHEGSTAEAYIKDYLRDHIPGGPAHATQFRTLTSTSRVKVAKVKITNAPKSLKAGKSIKLKTKITPAKATDKTVIWSSSNPKYATVNKYGKVTAKKAGKGKTVRITVKTKDGSKKKDTVKIKIK